MSGPDRFDRTLIALAATPGVVTDEALAYLRGSPCRTEISRVRRRAAARGAPGEIIRVGGLGYRMSADMRAWFRENTAS